MLLFGFAAIAAPTEGRTVPYRDIAAAKIGRLIVLQEPEKMWRLAFVFGLLLSPAVLAAERRATLHVGITITAPANRPQPTRATILSALPIQGGLAVGSDENPLLSIQDVLPTTEDIPPTSMADADAED